MGNPSVEFKTSLGSFTIELDPAIAPKTVENFLAYVDAGHYEGTLFHRVIPGFMVQGGGYGADQKKKPTKPAVENEASKEGKNVRGSVAMARTGDPHSATAQFFVNVADNGFLDHTEKEGKGWGYCVFGTVTSGMDVIDAIVKVKTGPKGPFEKDAPEEDVKIEKATRVDASKGDEKKDEAKAESKDDEKKDEAKAESKDDEKKDEAKAESKDDEKKDED
jgi:peptidyl-prolyl cis-trans isomerase B (cyclophilin B)